VLFNQADFAASHSVQNTRARQQHRKEPVHDLARALPTGRTPATPCLGWSLPAPSRPPHPGQPAAPFLACEDTFLRALTSVLDLSAGLTEQ
jgi:hypothetical protein